MAPVHAKFITILRVNALANKRIRHPTTPARTTLLARQTLHNRILPCRLVRWLDRSVAPASVLPHSTHCFAALATSSVRAGTGSAALASTVGKCLGSTESGLHFHPYSLCRWNKQARHRLVSTHGWQLLSTCVDAATPLAPSATTCLE